MGSALEIHARTGIWFHRLAGVVGADEVSLYDVLGTGDNNAIGIALYYVVSYEVGVSKDVNTISLTAILNNEAFNHGVSAPERYAASVEDDRPHIAAVDRDVRSRYCRKTICGNRHRTGEADRATTIKIDLCDCGIQGDRTVHCLAGPIARVEREVA